MAALIRDKSISRFQTELVRELSVASSDSPAFNEMCIIFQDQHLPKTYWLLVMAEMGTPTMITCPEVTEQRKMTKGYISAMETVWDNVVVHSEFESYHKGKAEAELYAKLREKCIPISMGISFGIHGVKPQFFFIFGPTEEGGNNHIVLLSDKGVLHVTDMSPVVANSFECFTAYNNDEEIPGLGPRLLQTPLFKN